MKLPWLYLALVTGLLALDQWSKHVVRETFILGQAKPYPWPGVFELKLAYNEGIAFGMMQGRGQLFAPVAAIIAIGATWYAWKHLQVRGLQILLGLLTAGAIGNMIDRLREGRVTDMFWFRAINFPVFNVADVCLTFAAIGLIVLGMFEKKPETADARTEP